MKAKKFFATLFLLTGILSVILSFTVADSVSGGYEANITYGGDAYTGIQNAAAQSANNILALNSTLALGFQSVLLVGGLTLIFSSLIFLTSNKELEDERAEENQTKKIKTNLEAMKNVELNLEEKLNKEFVCPQCGKPVNYGDSYCDCGQRFDWNKL